MSGSADAHLERGGHHQQDQDAADDEEVALALLLLVGTGARLSGITGSAPG